MYVGSVWINAKTKIQSVLLVIIFQWCLSNRSNVKSLVSPESPQQPAFVAQQWRRRRKTSRIVSFFWPWWWKFFLKKIWERVAGEEKASQPSKQVRITTATKYESLIFLKKLTYYGSSLERLMTALPGLEAKPFRLQRLRAEFESHTYSEIWLHFIFIGLFNTSLTLLWLNKLEEELCLYDLIKDLNSSYSWI